MQPHQIHARLAVGLGLNSVISIHVGLDEEHKKEMFRCHEAVDARSPADMDDGGGGAVGD